MLEEGTRVVREIFRKEQLCVRYFLLLAVLPDLAKFQNVEYDKDWENNTGEGEYINTKEDVRELFCYVVKLYYIYIQMIDTNTFKIFTSTHFLL